jgi:hypothetical protein
VELNSKVPVRYERNKKVQKDWIGRPTKIIEK